MINVNSKKHILVIDDEEEIRFLLETKFFKLGYQVSVAATGLQAMQKIKSGSKYDLIICDLKMPKMNGIEFYLESQKLDPNVQFLLITGQPDREKLLKAMKNGVVNIMLKPVKHSDIVEKIIQLIGNPNREPLSA
ncbi:MAG: response regulator [Bdellovibrionales bacterium]|nr:response regulator [Bdellovibrionales bacterium]